MGLEPITCPKCGGTIHIPSHEKTCYCTYCGAQLFFDDGSRTITYRTVDEARIKEIALESLRVELEEKRRPGRVKTMVILAVVGAVMMILGQFAGHASGDPDSPWYMLAILGMFPLLAVAFVWLDSGDSAQKKDR